MAKSIDQKINELSNKNQEILKIMVEALEATDAYTKGHSERVALYVYLLGEKLNYPDMDKLISAALLHDIGKIAVPEHILNKPGKLLDEEYDQIKKHVDTGHRILNKSSSFNEIESLVHCHHERLDGKGYPRGLSGNSIPLGAQIISICDVYDALTSDRPYRKAMSKEKALAIIESEREKQFSSFLVDAFLSVELA
jgi:putative nucleotidyltransferase with HDIG domain